MVVGSFPDPFENVTLAVEVLLYMLLEPNWKVEVFNLMNKTISATIRRTLYRDFKKLNWVHAYRDHTFVPPAQFLPDFTYTFPPRF